MTHAIVTGATGFLGSALTRRLVDLDWDVHVIHRDTPASTAALAALRSLGVEVHTFRDVTQVREIAARFPGSTAFHLATNYLRDHTPADIAPLIAANIEYGTHLLDGLAGSESRAVAAMSFFQYRDGRPAPNSLYSATKQAFSEVAAYYRERRALDVREVVLFDTYGPGDTRDKLVPALIEAARTGTSLTLGNRAQLIDLTFVEDVVAGLIAAADETADTRVAIRAQAPSTIAELVAAVEVASGTRLDASFDDSRAVNDLVTEAGDWAAPGDWTPRVDLATGLRRTIETGSTA